MTENLSPKTKRIAGTSFGLGFFLGMVSCLCLVVLGVVVRWLVF